MKTKPRKPIAAPKRVRISLTVREADAIVAAVVDCAMEGMEKPACFEQTWGEDWKKLRPAAMAAADRLYAMVQKGRKAARS